MDLEVKRQQTSERKSAILPVLEEEKIEVIEEEVLFKKILESHPELNLHASLNESKHNSRKFVNIMVCGDQGTGKSSFIEFLLKVMDFPEADRLFSQRRENSTDEK